MSEHELRQAFRELTAPVRPSADGYDVVMRRHRRGRRALTSVKVLAGVLVVVAAWPVIGRIQSGVSDPDGPIFRPPNDNGPMTPWVRALIDAPTRGSLAADAAFLAEVVALHDVPFGSRLKVLFAGDVGDFRIVLTAYHDSDRQIGVRLTAPRGTPAHRLGEDFFASPLTPYTAHTMITRDAMWPTIVILGLAPQGCAIATAKGQGSWQQGADPATMVHEGDPSGWQARVTCSGVVRYQGPLDSSTSYSQIDTFTPTDAQVSQALEGARGSVPWQAAHDLVSECSLGDAFKILYGGTVPGSRGPVYVAWCRLLDGRWEIRVREHNGSVLAGLPADADLTAPGTIVAAPSSAGVIVVAPATASKVDLVDAAGTLVGSAPLSEGVGVLPRGSKGTLRATDPAGHVVGTGTTPIDWQAPPLWTTIGVSVDRWD
ncbi:hypothetical protein [Allorhizocola rhizosphaerae]|uniref:hypothetical protein n=1 Tax=Allorhizocola rhizosphaerae TaxID=1872709 RepID=UPI000E3BF9DD|nr:hypothetical protein [Allorhizocola rhizosphaerae]